MIDQLESDLRAALRDRAAKVPAASSARLTHLDYRPRTRALRPPVAIGALAGAAGTAGAIAAVITLGAGATNAFAGWSRVPTAPAPMQIATAGVSCKAQPQTGGLPLKLADTRGPFTFMVYADSNASAVCISGPTFTSVSGTRSSLPITVPDGKVQLSAAHMTNRDGQAYSFADGHTGADVTGVTLILDDGTSVQATVGGGWFVAWWPSPHSVKSAELATPSGVKTQTFDLSGQSPCGPNPCTGGAFGVESSGAVGARGATVTSGGSISIAAPASSGGPISPTHGRLQGSNK
jgi:hypothetical protein